MISGEKTQILLNCGGFGIIIKSFGPNVKLMKVTYFKPLWQGRGYEEEIYKHLFLKMTLPIKPECVK